MNKDMAAFSYVWIMSVLLYAARRDSPFIRYHSKQAMVLFFLSIGFAIIPFIGQFLMLFAIAGMLYGFVTAAQGQYTDIPIVTQLAKGEMTIQDLFKVFRDGWRSLVTMFREAKADSKATPSSQNPKPPAEPDSQPQPQP